MSFAIYRTAKLKSFGEIGASLSHTYRTRETLNADALRANLNEHSFKTYNSCFDAIKNQIPQKRRKDAVLCIEHLITASPNWDGWGTDKEMDFFRQSKKFLEEKYGKNNIVAMSIHRDETTPHLIVYVVPVDEKTGRLNAKKWLGGRAKLTQTQTAFAKAVEQLGLKRGVENSKANHKTIQKYYSEINEADQNLKSEVDKKIHAIENKTSDIQFPEFSFSDSFRHELKEKKIKSYQDAVHILYEEQSNKMQSDFIENLEKLDVSYKKKIHELEQKLKDQHAYMNSQITIQKQLRAEIDNLKSEYINFANLKSKSAKDFDNLNNDAKSLILEIDKKLDAERKQEIERQQRVEIQAQRVLKQREQERIACIEQAVAQRKENRCCALNDELNARLNASSNDVERLSIEQLLEFRKTVKSDHNFDNSVISRYLSVVESGKDSTDYKFLDFYKLMKNVTSKDMYTFNRFLGGPALNFLLSEECFSVIETIQSVVDQRLETIKFDSEKKSRNEIEMLSDFSDMLLENTNNLYKEYLKTELTNRNAINLGKPSEHLDNQHDFDNRKDNVQLERSKNNDNDGLEL